MMNKLEIVIKKEILLTTKSLSLQMDQELIFNLTTPLPLTPLDLCL